ncbi:MAG: DNA cytosine methyltransferase, partial [Zestosphaera sp.]
MRRRKSLVDLFAGGGGFSRGFYEAGFEPVLAVEI